jgi:hypothetical protein
MKLATFTPMYFNNHYLVDLFTQIQFSEENGVFMTKAGIGSYKPIPLLIG